MSSIASIARFLGGGVQSKVLFRFLNPSLSNSGKAGASSFLEGKISPEESEARSESMKGYPPTRKMN